MRILLGLDGSEISHEALDEVVRRPWPAGSTVRIVTAIDIAPPPIGELAYIPSDLDAARVGAKQSAEQIGARAQERLLAAGLGTEHVARDGDPRSVLVDEAKDWDADLIVVGSHGYRGIKRWLLGSVAQSVVGHAPCSVEVVRRKGRQE